jgi:glycosyltransferase involved in cell wall biosynthesis
MLFRPAEDAAGAGGDGADGGSSGSCGAAGLRKELGIPEDAFVILYAGKLDEAKGGQLLADLTCEDLGTNREIVYLIIGNTVGEYGAKVEKTFEESPYRVVRIPTQKYADLSKYYQIADLSLIPAQCSLNFYDLQACGLPVIAEDNEINAKRTSYGNGWTFRPGDVEDFKARVRGALEMDGAEYKTVSDNALRVIRETYDYQEKAREYEKEILDAIERYRQANAG